MRLSLLFSALAIALSLLGASINAELYEVTLTVESIDCPFCVKQVEQELETVHQIDNFQIVPHENVVSIEWKKNTPFEVVYLIQPFTGTKFNVQNAFVDLEGTFHMNGETRTISMKDGTIFHISNLRSENLQGLGDGDTVRVKGYVFANQGFNFLAIQNVLWRNLAPTATTPHFPSVEHMQHGQIQSQPKKG